MTDDTHTDASGVARDEPDDDYIAVGASGQMRAMLRKKVALEMREQHPDMKRIEGYVRGLKTFGEPFDIYWAGQLSARRDAHPDWPEIHLDGYVAEKKRRVPDSRSASPATSPNDLVYGVTVRGHLVFAREDEVQMYARLRQGDEFPMSWATFRKEFGEAEYTKQIAPSLQDLAYPSFDAFLKDEFFSGEYDHAFPKEIFEWAAYDGQHELEESCGSYCYHQLREETGASREAISQWHAWFVERHPQTDPAISLDEFASCVRSYIDDLVRSAKSEYYDLDVGGFGGRAPQDDDAALFYDQNGEESDSPESILYWPEQVMLDWFPPDVATTFGHVVFTLMDGEYLELDDARESEIVAMLEERGYRCRDDQQLLNRAVG